MPFKYVGRKHSFIGKSVWDLVRQLPNCGEGRLIYRYMFMRYTEPSVMRIVEAKPKQDKHSKFGYLMVESWFRGQYLGHVDMSRPSYKPDFNLVPSDEEHLWLDALKNYEPPPKKVLPNSIAMPPVMRLWLEQQEGMKVDRVPLQVKLDDNIHAKLQEEGEEPNVSTNEIDGLGTTDFPFLYEGIDLTQATHPPDPNSYRGPAVPRPTNPRDDFKPNCPIYLQVMSDREEDIS